MKFHDFSPFYRSGEGIRSKVSGDRLIDNPAVADAQGGASFHLNGTTDWVKLDTTMKLNDQMSYEMVIKKDSDLSSTAGAVFNHGQDASNDARRFIWLEKTGTYGGIRSYKTVSGSGANFSTTVPADYFSRDRHIVYVDDGTAIKIYGDGVELVTTVATGSYPTLSGTSVAQFDIQLGGRYTGNGDSNQTAIASFFDGSISRFKAHNRALSAAEVRASYNGQAVPYEYVGAKQDELVTNGTFETDLSDWTEGSEIPAARVTTNAATGSASVEFAQLAAGESLAGSSNNWFGDDSVFLNDGKRYKVTFSCARASGTGVLEVGNGYWGACQVNGATATQINNIADAALWIKTPTVSQSSVTPSVGSLAWIKVDYEFTTHVIGASGRDNLNFAVNGIATWYVDDVSVTQIGCVAEYLPSGINSTRWMDTSGNGLHGTTSTATAVNHKIGSLTLATLSTDAVTFDSASGTTTSSTLDHFEQGTWAPVLSDGTNNATMHANNIGTYTRIGSTVFVNAQVMVSSLGSVSGNVRITGLPYQPATTTDVRTYWAAASVTHGWSLAITANQSVGGFIRDNQSYIELRLWDATGGTTELQHSEVTADGELMIHAMYYC